jgi:hypothetical protein
VDFRNHLVGVLAVKQESDAKHAIGGIAFNHVQIMGISNDIHAGPWE